MTQVMKTLLLNIWAKYIYTSTFPLIHVFKHFSKPVVIFIDINIRTSKTSNLDLELYSIVHVKTRLIIQQLFTTGILHVHVCI